MTPEERAELAREEAQIAERFAALKAERDAVSAQLAAFAPPGTLHPGETPALCGTCKDRLCVPGLPGCARCTAAEVERLRAELATRTDERDDAMNGWKKADTEAEQLREALDKTRDHRTYLQDRLGKAQKEAAGRKRYGDNLRTESERLRAELATVLKNYEHLQGTAIKLEGERDEARAELAARCDMDGCEQYREWLSGEKAEADKRARQAETERDRLAGQVQGIEQAVHAFFADADQRGVHLDGMTVDELCAAVMAEIRALDGTEAGR